MPARGSRSVRPRSRASSSRCVRRRPEFSRGDPRAKPRPRIKNVSWVGGYLDGVSVPISPDLTALIGGRGAGKSTVIESIRYALDIRPISDQMTRDHTGIVEHVLNAGTIVRVEVESVAELVKRFAGSDGVDPALEGLRERLRGNREDLIRAERAKAKLDDEQTEADRLEEQLDRYKDTDVPGKLHGHTSG